MVSPSAKVEPLTFNQREYLVGELERLQTWVGDILHSLEKWQDSMEVLVNNVDALTPESEFDD